jgi:DNA topoisomerase-1
MPKSYNIDYYEFIKLYKLFIVPQNKSNNISFENMLGGAIRKSNKKILFNQNPNSDTNSDTNSNTDSDRKNNPIWFDNFMGLYEKTKSGQNHGQNHRQNHSQNPKRMIPIIHPNFGREMAFDDQMKKKKKGIYRVKYDDPNDLDKKGVPKTKFKYYHMDNDREVSSEELIRINKLGLAPAYIDVWVSSDPNSKIQATGIDAKGRKQYRYNQNHIAEANIDKFLRLYKFIKSIHKLDSAMEKDIKGQLYSKNRTISTMLKIVQKLFMRVGKEIYAKTNKSYGITSMKKSHVKIEEKKVKFNFKAKSNKQVQYTLDDVELIGEVKQLMDLDGEKMFQYKSDSGNILRATDVDLNQYIQEKMGKGFSVKDFRTYASNFYFIKSLLKETKNRNPVNKKIIKQNLNLAQENTAHYLRHTKSISKKSYTMGLIRDLYDTDPSYFIENKNKQPLTVLLDLLKKFKDNINSERKKNKQDEVDEEKVEIKEDTDDKDE